jgi:glucose-6-phosphate isomerase, archaeal
MAGHYGVPVRRCQSQGASPKAPVPRRQSQGASPRVPAPQLRAPKCLSLKWSKLAWTDHFSTPEGGFRLPAFEVAAIPGVKNDDLGSSAESTQQRPFALALDYSDGALAPPVEVRVRRLSDMAGFYEDRDAVDQILASGEDPVIYQSRHADVPELPGNLAFLTTTIAAGTVGSEFYMTRGHHHALDSAELYLGLSGHGIMLMEPREGDFACQALAPNVAVYVPPGWAHRTINTGTEPFVFLACYFAGAGHDYSSVERHGFSRRVFQGASGAEVRPPRRPREAGRQL